MARRTSLHKTVAVEVGATPEPERRHLQWPWQLTAVVGALAVLLGGWLVLAAFALVGWLTSPDTEFAAALRLAADVLVLGHGGPVVIGGQAVSIVPLGLTLLLVFVALPVASFAARQAAHQDTEPDDTGRVWVDGEPLVLRVAGVFGGSYVAGVIALGLTTGTLTLQLIAGAVAVGGIAGLLGASRGVDFDPTRAWPRWLRAVPRAMGAALLTVLAGSAALVAIAAWGGRERIATIVDSLDGGGAGLVLLAALHIAYLPNLVLAAASWALGAGITLGDGSSVTVTATDVGLLPAIPAMGLVPEPGLASPALLWWLLLGVVAGAIAAVAVALARPRARFDETSLVGGLAGVAAGLLTAVACLLAAGGLGSDRLAHIGAKIEILIFAPTILGLSGMAVGLAIGLIRRPPRPVVAGGAEKDADSGDDPETLPDGSGAGAPTA